MPSNYLLRVNGRYYFRIHIPLDLRRWFVGRREIKRSLKSGNLEFAKSSARHWVYRTERIFAQIRKGHCCSARRRKSKGTGVIARQTRSTYFGNGNSRLIPATSAIPPPSPMMTLPGRLNRMARTRYR